MGYSHAVTGAAVWCAVAAPTGIIHGTGATAVAGYVAGALVSAGAALLPDLDHRGATIARALPPVTTLLSVLIGALSGGHRKGTHSMVGIVAFTLAAWASALWEITVSGTVYHPGPAIGAVVMVSLAMKVLRLGDRPAVSWFASLGAGLLILLTADPHSASWFPVAIAIGVATHILGDMLTVNGVPLLWPFTTKPLRLPVLGTTGSVLEKVLVGLSAVSIVFTAMWAMPTLLAASTA